MRRNDERMLAALCGLDLLISPSEFQREKFIEFGLPTEQVRVVPYGFDRSRFAGIEERKRASAKIRVGYLGSVIPSKGVHTLLEAFAQIGESLATLDIHGAMPSFHGDHSYPERIDKMLRKNPGAKIHGRYVPEELAGILKQIDILVVPSLWYETYCMTIREGFLAGIPVLASRLGAMEEAIEDGKTGLLFEPGKAKDLRKQLLRLIEDPMLRQRLASAGKDVLDLEENAERHLRIYRELLDG